MELRRIVSDAFHFFVGNIKQIAVLCLPFLLAVAVFNNVVLDPLQAVEESGNVFLISWFVKLMVHPIYMAALILLMARRAENQNPRNRELLTGALQRYTTLLILNIIVMALISSGIMLMILPGLWAAVRLWFAKYFLVLEGSHPREAIIKSYRATAKHFWLILSLMALFGLPILILVVSIVNLFSVVGGNRTLLVVVDTAIPFLMLFIDVVLFRVFMGVVREAPELRPVA